PATGNQEEVTPMHANLPVALNFVSGEWLTGGQAPLESVNPAYGSVLGHYHPGSAALTGQAVASARAAFDEGTWAASPRLRAAALFELADRLEEAKEELAALIVAENGKLASEAAGEMAGTISEVRYYAGLARNIFGRTLESAPGQISLLHREPA